MGSLFSKDKKRKDEERKRAGSAPSRLEGLDGTTPTPPEVPKRALTPDTASRQKSPSPVAVSAAPESPSPASTGSPTETQRPTISNEEEPLAPAAAPSSEPAAPESKPSPPKPSEPKDFSPPTLASTPSLPSAPSVPECGTPTRRAPMKTDYVGMQSDGKKLAADLPAAVQVPEEAAAWTAVLGESTVRSLYSPDWKTRELALQSVLRSIGNARFNAEHGSESIWNTVTQLLDKALKDKVAPLYHAALELLATLVASYSPQLPYSVLSQGLEPLMHTLLHRVGNNNARIQETSIQALLTLANQPALGLAFLAPHALSPIPKKSQTGAAAASQMSGRLELITCMLNVQVQQQLGFGTAGRTPAAAAAGRSASDSLSAEEVVKFTRPALDMPDDKVRAAAVRLVAEVYRNRKAAGRPFEVEKMLGAGLKPALLQVLHRRFAEVDEEIANGGPSTGGVRAGAGVDDLPVGSGISIKAPGSAGRGSALPPLANKYGGLPALAVRGSRPATGTPPMSAGGADPSGRPPRTPLSPGSAPGGSRCRTPPRQYGPGGRVASPMRGGGSPSRGSPGEEDPSGGGAFIPGFMPEGDGGEGAEVMMIHSGTSTPVRGNSSQSVRAGSSQSTRGNSSLKPRSRGGAPAGANNNLDAAEEQLIEYILNNEARAAA